MNDYNLPIELKFLFQNQYLDSVKLFIILKHFQRRKKGILFDELNYYFTMIEVLGNDLSIPLNKEYFQDNLFTNEFKIKKLSIILGNQDYISIIVERTSKKSFLYFKLNLKGNDLLDELENDYFTYLSNKFQYIYNVYRYSISEQRKVIKRYEK